MSSQTNTTKNIRNSLLTEYFSLQARNYKKIIVKRISMGMSVSKMLIKCKVTKYHVMLHVTCTFIVLETWFWLASNLDVQTWTGEKRHLQARKKNIGLKKKHRIKKKSMWCYKQGKDCEPNRLSCHQGVPRDVYYQLITRL